jgi:hypothetical protein
VAVTGAKRQELIKKGSEAMSLIACEKSGTHIEPIEPGVYVGICYGVIDLGTHENQVYNKESRKVLIQWEIPECRGTFETDGEEKDLPRVISKRYTLSLSEKANLRKDLESWRGRKFTAEELKGFDLKNVLGTPCQLQIVHETGKDGARTYANIAAIMALPKGTKPPQKTENPEVFFSLDEAGDRPSLPDVPEWIQKIIQESNEWRERVTGESPESATSTEKAETEKGEAEDDDFPF